jgi:hypothetical protein
LRTKSEDLCSFFFRLIYKQLVSYFLCSIHFFFLCPASDGSIAAQCQQEQQLKQANQVSGSTVYQRPFSIGRLIMGVTSRRHRSRPLFYGGRDAAAVVLALCHRRTRARASTSGDM